jgi:3-oxoacyl-[acyl-carrier protein] reductase
VTINIVSPGFVETAMTTDQVAGRGEKLLAAIPVGRMGQPKDVAAAVVYLASDEASWVTGATLHVNGGMVMI